MNQKIDIGTEIDLQDLLASRMLIQANSGGGKSGLARKIIEQAYGKVPFIVIDYDGEYYTLKEKLSDVIVIGGHAPDIPISLQAAKLLPREIVGNRLSVVIDPSEMKMGGRIQYVKTFLETMMELGKAFWTPFLVFIEEAHKYCGEQEKQESGPAVRDLMSRGRKMGYCGILMTQRISKLHKDAAAECNNKFIGRTVMDIDMDRAARELGFTASSEYTRLSLRELTPRHFYCYGTSINPHYVHEITVGLCETTIPEHGIIVDIKPKKPTEKLLAALNKLAQLPAAAEKEMKDIQQLQAEVKRLNGELAKIKKTPTSVPAYPHLNEKQVQQAVDRTADKVRTETANHYRGIIREKEAAVKKLMTAIQQMNMTLAKIKDLAVIYAISAPLSTNNETISPKKETILAKSETKVPRIDKKNAESAKNSPSSDKMLSKCAKAILCFLAGFSDRKFTKAQVAIATNYSSNSGSFRNALSELSTAGLIVRGDRLTYNPAAMDEIINQVGPIETREYDISTFRENLGKCEQEIYDVLLECPHDIHSKESLAEKTTTGYSASSGSFRNALSRLSTLEIITRERSGIRLNPELLELL